MARTFDALANISYMWFYDDSITTWTSRNITSGDYFDNNAAVNDFVFFVVSLTRATHNLRVNVGTALVASTITLVWEFYKRDGTWATLTLTADPTNSFQNTGVNTITFNVPDEWTSIRTGDLSGTNKPTTAHMMAIRARISSVTSITEGGANITNAIQTNDWMITIPSGDSVVPNDLYNDDISGGWGVITRDVEARNYVCTANIIVAAGGTFTIANWIQWQTGQELKWRTFYNAGTLTLGVKSGNDINQGARFIYYNILGPYLIAGAPGLQNSWTGTFNCYNSYFWKRGSPENPTWAGNNWMYNSIFETEHGYFRWYWPGAASSGVIQNCVFSGPNNTTSRGIYFYAGSIAIDNMLLGKGAQYTLGSNSAIFTNTRIASGKKINTGNSTFDRVRDCIFEDALTTHFSGNMNTEALVQCTVSIIVLSPSGNVISSPNVLLINSQGTTLFNGVWSVNLVVDVWKKNVASITDYNPMQIWISKSGYQTYYSKFTLDTSNKDIMITLSSVTFLGLKVKT